LRLTIHITPLRYNLFPYTTLFRSRNELISSPSVGTIQASVSATTATFRPALETPAEIRWDHRNLAGAERTGGVAGGASVATLIRSEEHTSELQSRVELVCRLLLET